MKNRSRRWMAGGTSWVLALSIMLGVMVVPESASACKLYGFVARHVPENELYNELTTFATTQNGNERSWAMGFWENPDTGMDFKLPLVHRRFLPAVTPAGCSGASCTESPYYTDFKDYLEDILPKAIVGHLRVPSTGSGNIPDPHPFHKAPVGTDWLFAHNGTIPLSNLQTLVNNWDATHSGMDYMTDGRTAPVYSPRIDSEVFFIYVLQRMSETPECPQAGIWDAVQAVRSSVGTGPSLNFVMTDGTTLYAVRFPGANTTAYPLYYKDAKPEFRVVSSKSLDASFVSFPATGTMGTLAVMRPCYPTEFYALGPSQARPVCLTVMPPSLCTAAPSH
jgi:predicted glutamine amidotransferase